MPSRSYKYFLNKRTMRFFNELSYFLSDYQLCQLKIMQLRRVDPVAPERFVELENQLSLIESKMLTFIG